MINVVRKELAHPLVDTPAAPPSAPLAEETVMGIPSDEYEDHFAKSKNEPLQIFNLVIISPYFTIQDTVALASILSCPVSKQVHKYTIIDLAPRDKTLRHSLGHSNADLDKKLRHRQL
jgi:hypothetical protein